MSELDRTIHSGPTISSASIDLDRAAIVAAVHAAVPIVFVDASLDVLFANVAARRLFADSGDIIIGGNLIDLLPGLRAFQSQTWGALRQLELLDDCNQREVQMEARSGERSFEVEIEVRAASVETIEGRVVLIRDMVEANASMAAILDAQRDLEEFNRMAVGRELKMVELKREINELCDQQGLPPRYDLDL